MKLSRWNAGALLLSLLWSGTLPAEQPVRAAEIRRLGIEGRLDPGLRDARLRELAEYLKSLPADRVSELQDPFQYALLLFCDPDIYDTLSPKSISAVDTALEALFDLEDIDRDNRWEPLIYVYGYFNRDVTPAAIRKVLTTWDRLSDEEKNPRFPTYIHVIDAVCKPLAMGPLARDSDTGAALSIVVPAMKSMFLLSPKPGTAFHSPSHACLVLAPLYDRWAGHPEFGAIVTEHLGDREHFAELLATQLPGAHADPAALTKVDYTYYAYFGAYLANALARLDARSVAPVLARSLALYEARGEQGRVMAYTRRALIALGDPAARKAFEVQLYAPEMRESVEALLVWIARNGRGEGREYGLAKLGSVYGCAPEDALAEHFRRELRALGK